MYVCLCNAVTDRQIKQAIASGDNNLSDVKKRLGVANQCGKCAQLATKIIQSAVSERDNFYEVA
ncbi:bacterioferritin-associated ferredoxin [Shewanella marina]|uniref:bacterioferritin-associated ferredoxin n=1 Tax=Shewanella marina TaxID=487319 RepID=UPI000472B1C8|nr:bacterioferritin-associated ferredoxin [Shewanella marina]